MVSAGAVRAQCGEVSLGGVASVPVEFIFGMKGREPRHHAVAQDLGDNRGRRDRQGQRVAFHDGRGGAGQAGRRIVAIDLASSGETLLADGLAHPFGLLACDGAVICSESWRHRVLRRLEFASSWCVLALC